MPHPKVIFLDAVGTLFGVKGSVGQIYSEIAKSFGVDANPEKLNQAFFKNFKAAPPMAFPGIDPTSVPAQEYAWWKAIAISTFKMAKVYDQFSDFDNFFGDLYFHFATAKPWFIYPDVQGCLEYWRSQRIELGVLSNFDSRIYPVLELLNLANFFKSVTISTEVGAAKPNPQVFAIALQKHNCLASEAWHVGDSYEQDYEGAKTAGLKGIWLNRK
ncbi:MAG: HAD family hydrolase [Leptolyngbyaceae cyanobacterium MO_188.B28]|nr:HAD family hydrolase [Leptolyngbyaceae cyanobacterium MO_188.B28]